MAIGGGRMLKRAQPKRRGDFSRYCTLLTDRHASQHCALRIAQLCHESAV